MPTDYNRIRVTQDIRHCDGHLRVAKGAVGTIRSHDAGMVGVAFDEGQNVHIEPGYKGRLFQTVPFVHTRPLAY